MSINSNEQVASRQKASITSDDIEFPETLRNRRVLIVPNLYNAVEIILQLISNLGKVGKLITGDTRSDLSKKGSWNETFRC